MLIPASLIYEGPIGILLSKMPVFAESPAHVFADGEKCAYGTFGVYLHNQILYL
jgi:hypothetical protein